MQIIPSAGEHAKIENGATLLERSKRKKNRSVVISARIEKMAFFPKFFFLVLVTPLPGSLKRNIMGKMYFFVLPCVAV